jgi:pyruvate kinase
MRKTKIVCTLGPSSRDPEVIRKMLLAGMNVARMNFSHGSHAEHKEAMDTFRRVRDKLGVPAAVLLDTRGPEIRIKDFEKGEAVLPDGGMFTITTRDVPGNENIVSVTYDDLPKEVAKGNHIMINDGKVILQVREVKGCDVVCDIIHGGKLSNHKGVNLPNINISMEYLSDQDKSDILFGIENDVDYISASFIRSAADVNDVRKLLNENGGSDIKIIAKIESTQGIENFEEILQAADGIMVARGDMGVEVAYEKLPGIQKRFIRRCVQSGKIVITATQMLESMTSSPLPTRAEITDVANAVFDGTWAVMLSGETAAGDYPVEAVKAMAKIATQAEKDQPKISKNETIWHEMSSSDVTNAMGHAACTLAEDVKAGALMAVTKTGYTARRMSKFRPDVNIIGATPSPKTYHQLSLAWGVTPLIVNSRDDVEEMFVHCVHKALEAGLVEEGDKLVLSAGIPLDVPGNTNIIRIMDVEK